MRRAVVLAVLLASTAVRADEPTPADTTYVVEPGDTCLGIAVRVLGDREQLDALHRVNPQLGALPHDLVPGSILNLPPRTTTPDAQVTRARGDVKLRKASSSAWDVAVRGAFMFRAWRAWSGEQSNAELAFRDDSKLGMRERTIVVVYGPEKKLAKVITATAELAQGTLESRLGDLDGKPVIVRTPAAETDLRAGDVLVSAAIAGASIVANHRGTPVAVRGRGVKGKGVSVDVGMGSRVFPGKPPEPPRPLPPIPTWSTPVTAFVALKGVAPRAELAWAAVPTATSYRVAVRDVQGEEVLAVTSPTPRATLSLPASADPYRVTVSASDAEGFESAPSTPIFVWLYESATTSAQLAVGETFMAPPGMLCRVGENAALERTVLAAPGKTTIACATREGRVAASLVVDVTGAPPVTRDAVREAPGESTVRPVPSSAPAGDRFHLGVLAGYTTFGRGIALGDPMGPEDELAGGALGGIRAGWSRRWFGLEAEAAFARAVYAGGSDRATVRAARAFVQILRPSGATTVGLAFGGGVHAVSAHRPGTQADTDPVISVGALAAYRLGLVSLRLDLRYDACPATDGVAQGFDATFGASYEFGR